MRRRTDDLGVHDFCYDAAQEACRDMLEFEIEAYNFCLDMNYLACIEGVEALEEGEHDRTSISDY